MISPSVLQWWSFVVFGDSLSLVSPPIHIDPKAMAPKEPNRHQLSSKLSYSQDTPLFLQKLKNRIAGIPDEDEDEDPEFEDDGSGRPPIPRRPAIPTRPDDDPGSEQEDDADEKPQVVVLREGKHLTEREAENVRRKGQVLVYNTRIQGFEYFSQNAVYHHYLRLRKLPLCHLKEGRARQRSRLLRSRPPACRSHRRRVTRSLLGRSERPSVILTT